MDGPFGSNLPASCYVENGVPVVRGSNLTVGPGRFRDDGFVFVSTATAKRLERSLCRPLDIVLTKKGTLGQTGLIPSGGQHAVYLLSSNQMKLTVDRAVATPLFVYYFLSSPASVAKIIRDSEATGVPKTNIAYLRDFPITLPRLPEQRAIAHILSTLDDKIALNSRMNSTLEGISRAIFKSWFVDFDPVKQKAAGKQPVGMDAQTAALFPYSFEDSEIGELPKGWVAVPLAQMLSPRNERAGDRALIEYSSTNEGVFPRSERFNKQLAVSASKNKVIKRGDLVFGLSREVLNFGLMRDEIGSVSGAYKVFSIDGRMLTPDLLERIMRSRPNYYYGAVSASSREGQAVSTDSLLGLLVVVPPADLQAAFYETANKLDAAMVSCDRQARTLAALRDTLLPKLLSGEVRVPEAEGAIASATR